MFLEANFTVTGSKPSFQNVFHLLRLFLNCHLHRFVWSSVMEGGGKKFSLGFSPLDPTTGTVPGHGFLPSFA